MRVRVGWSGETSSNIWQKADVELSEEDLSRMLADMDLPEQVRVKLPVKFAYQMLALEAEALLLGKLVGLGYPNSTAAERVKSIEANQVALMDALKKSVSVPA